MSRIRHHPHRDGLFTLSRFPNEVDVTDVVDESSSNGASTPATETDDDFFSSWDKPTIKRPSNPPSRTTTPLQVNRTASPYLNPNVNGNGIGRPKSPLAGSGDPSARAIPSTAVRKAPSSTAAPRKANILGAKKTAKLGAKKVTGADDLDFEAAEKKAKEEAERIEKLGYDPNADSPTDSKAKIGTSSNATNIVSPTPISPRNSMGGNTRGIESSNGEVEKVAMGMGRLGFGQVGASKAAASAPKKMAFGSVGASRTTQTGTYHNRPPCEY